MPSRSCAGRFCHDTATRDGRSPWEQRIDEARSARWPNGLLSTERSREKKSGLVATVRTKPRATDGTIESDQASIFARVRGIVDAGMLRDVCGDPIIGLPNGAR